MKILINFILYNNATSTIFWILYRHKTINILIKLSKTKKFEKKSTKNNLYFKKNTFLDIINKQPM